MAADPNPTLSAELLAARAVLAPQLEGLADFERTSISPELAAKIEEVRGARAHRDALLQAALTARDSYIAALDALERDGYPALPNVQVQGSLFSELQEEQSNLQSAVAVFMLEQTIAIDTGAATFTAQAAPSKPGP